MHGQAGIAGSVNSQTPLPVRTIELHYILGPDGPHDPVGRAQVITGLRNVASEIDGLELAVLESIDEMGGRHVQLSIENLHAPEVFFGAFMLDRFPLIIASPKQCAELAAGIGKTVRRAANL